MKSLKEKIEKQLAFAQERQVSAKYLEHLKWDGYIQALRFALSNIKDYEAESQKMPEGKNESIESKVGVI